MPRNVKSAAKEVQNLPKINQKSKAETVIKNLLKYRKHIFKKAGRRKVSRPEKHRPRNSIAKNIYDFRFEYYHRQGIRHDSEKPNEFNSVQSDHKSTIWCNQW